jgi:hypothetical protein
VLSGLKDFLQNKKLLTQNFGKKYIFKAEDYVLEGKLYEKYMGKIILLASLKSLKIRVGSGFMSQRSGSGSATKMSRIPNTAYQCEDYKPTYCTILHYISHTFLAATVAIPWHTQC